MAYDPQGPLPRLGGLFPFAFHVGLADGSARPVPREVLERTLRALLSRDAGAKPGPDW